MCSRRKLFSARPSQKVSIQSEDRTLPHFPEQFSAELAEVWLRCVHIFSEYAAEIKHVSTFKVAETIALIAI